MTLLVNPTQRWSAQIAELTGGSKIIMGSGRTTANTSTPNFCSDWFSWNGSQWSQLTGVLPPYRAEGMMSFDGTNITLLGGNNGQVNLSDQWNYNGTVWAQTVLPALTIPYTRPTTLTAGMAAYQSAGPEVVVFSGKTPFNREYNLNTWTFSSPSTWTLTTQAVSPPARAYAGCASSSLKMVIFGGKNFDGPLADTWVFNGTSWQNVSSGTPGINCPSARYGCSMVYDSSQSLILCHGGITKEGFSAELWSFNITSSIWTNITPINRPGARAFSAFAYSTNNSNNLLFGGRSYNKCYGDTWVLTGSTFVQQ